MENLVVFQSTYQAMELESQVKEKQLKARLIPTPESISASCGLALKFQETDLAVVLALLTESGNRESNIYQILLKTGGKQYQLLESDEEEN